MQTRGSTRIDKDYIDHAIKFMERRALPDDDPSLKRLNLEIVQVNLTHGFNISGFCVPICRSCGLNCLIFL